MHRRFMVWLLGMFPEVAAERKRLIDDIQRLATETADIRTTMDRELDQLRRDNVTLSKAYEEERAENMRLRDRLEDSLRDRAELWKLTNTCLDGERKAYQMHVNLAWQQKGAGIPYPEQPHYPPKDPAARTTGGRRLQLPEDKVRQETEAFLRSFYSR